MKIAVVGSRTFNDYSRMKKILNQYIPFILISGGAQGADSLAERFAKEYELTRIIYPAKWKKYGKKAGFIRNRKIIEKADLVIAFWDGKSRGTKMIIKLADDMMTKIVIKKF